MGSVMAVEHGVPAVFLDLNGTLVMPVQVQHPRDHALLPVAIPALLTLGQHGFLCPVITVQSRITRGVYTLEDFTAWFAGLQTVLHTAGVELLGPYVCPHGRTREGFREPCACKKPQPLLYQQAAVDLGIDVGRSFVIGDTAGDMLAARALGCPGILVRTGWGERSIRNESADLPASFVAADIAGAAAWIVNHSSIPPSPRR